MFIFINKFDFEENEDTYIDYRRLGFFFDQKMFIKQYIGWWTRDISPELESCCYFISSFYGGKFLETVFNTVHSKCNGEEMFNTIYLIQESSNSDNIDLIDAIISDDNRLLKIKAKLLLLDQVNELIFKEIEKNHKKQRLWGGFHSTQTVAIEKDLEFVKSFLIRYKEGMLLYYP